MLSNTFFKEKYTLKLLLLFKWPIVGASVKGVI